MCKQHVTVVAAGGEARLNYFIYSFTGTPDQSEGMINGTGKENLFSVFGIFV